MCEKKKTEMDRFRKAKYDKLTRTPWKFSSIRSRHFKKEDYSRGLSHVLEQSKPSIGPVM